MSATVGAGMVGPLTAVTEAVAALGMQDTVTTITASRVVTTRTSHPPLTPPLEGKTEMPEPSADSPSTCGCGRAYWAEPGDAAQCGMCRVTSMSQNARPPTAEEEWVGEIVSAEEKLAAEVDAARRGVSAAENAHDQLCGHLYAIEYAETSDSAIGHQLRMARHALAAAAALIRQAYEAAHPGCWERGEAAARVRRAVRAEDSGAAR